MTRDRNERCVFNESIAETPQNNPSHQPAPERSSARSGIHINPPTSSFFRSSADSVAPKRHEHRAAAFGPDNTSLRLAVQLVQFVEKPARLAVLLPAFAA